MKKEEKTAGLQQLKATVWIGKKGITESTIDEIKMQIKERKIIKIKWLRNSEVDPEEVARMAGAVIIQKRGRTMILSKNK
ncbi:YhbY family RNA-binding protein [Methanolacinia petrolearia]|uniref:YhbY family RNA-binding protein n=1 Tax=Methanolacinia petrolearia TaxID=54120 RepID=UPI003BAC66D1